MKNTFDIKYFLIFTLTFIAFTAIGTVTHEYEHILVAKYFGHETSLHYGSMHYDSELNNELLEIYEKNQTAIKNNEYFDQKDAYESGIKILRSQDLWIAIGEPLQTILIGLVGLVILYFRRNKIKSLGFYTIDWLATFLSLFWLREIFNLFMSIASEIFLPKGSYFGGDEQYISQELHLWEGTIPIILGFLGGIISLFVVFKIIPKHLRLTFIASGFLGSIIGFILWMHILGPRLLP